MLYFSGLMDPPACVWCCGRELQCEVPAEEWCWCQYHSVCNKYQCYTAGHNSLIPNTEYDVSVAAINSAGEMSAYTETTQFELQGDLWIF